jgi:hypothetical protein
VSESVARGMHRRFERELADLAEAALHDEVVRDRALAERLVRLVGALLDITADHDVDDLGRCRICRHKAGALRGWRRAPCLVHDALRHHITGLRRDS